MAGTGPHADEIASRDRWVWRRVKVKENQCMMCDTWFKPNREDQAYCSLGCRLKAYRNRKILSEIAA